MIDAKRADAAGMKVARVLSIRDAGGTQGIRNLRGAAAVATPPVAVVEQLAANGSMVRLMPGQTESAVAIQVDFALVPKRARVRPVRCIGIVCLL